MDSLKTTGLKFSIDTSLDISLPLSILYDCGTIQALAEFLSEEVIGKGACKNDKLDAAVVSTQMPMGNHGNGCLSFAQQRLWFLDQFEPDSILYNIPVAMRLTGAIDVDAHKLSFIEIV